MWVVGLLLIIGVNVLLYRGVAGLIRMLKREDGRAQLKSAAKDSVEEIKKNISSDSARGVAGRNIGKFF